jgi:Saccharopine dehydrogenase C-terminal domain
VLWPVRFGEFFQNNRLGRRVNPAFALEMLPNRDSLPYAEKYGIPDVQSMFRGTLRYEVRCLVSPLRPLFSSPEQSFLGHGRVSVLSLQRSLTLDFWMHVPVLNWRRRLSLSPASPSLPAW